MSRPETTPGRATGEIVLAMAEELRMFLPPRQRADGRALVRVDGVSTLGHLVEAAGVPLTEAGRLLVDGSETTTAYRPRGGETAEIGAVARPQPIPGGPPRFLLDVHLGALARRMRLVGLDTAYHNDCDDPVLVQQANAERRVLLTRDRGLLHRRALWMGAYVRSTDPDGQFEEILDRFALPPLTPWTRCTSCNGALDIVAKEDVHEELPQGTRGAFERFARCRDCRRVYWHGAHGERLESIVEAAVARTGGPGTRQAESE